MVSWAFLIIYLSVYDWRQQSSLKPKLEYQFLQYALVNPDSRILISLYISMEVLKAGWERYLQIKGKQRLLIMRKIHEHLSTTVEV